LIGLRCAEIDVDRLAADGEFLQSAAWARHKRAFGWKARAFRFSFAEATSPDDDGAGYDLLVLSRKLFAGLTIAYVPHGPSLADVRSLQAELLQQGSDLSTAEILSHLSLLLKPRLPSAVFLRFDLNWPLTSAFSGNLAGRNVESSPVFAGEQHDPGAKDGISWEESALSARKWHSPGLRKSSADIQPPDSVIISIDSALRSEADILAAMKSKTRYNVRLAEKKGVEISRVKRTDYTVPPELHQWYDLYRITEERNRIALHSRQYYAHLFELTRADQCSLYLARHEEDLLAGIIVMRHGRKGWYLYGASSNVKRNLMPAYALQWAAIRDLREAGCISYDLFGIPPFAEKGHPMFGLYQFKTGFGGRIVHTPGAWDRPLKPFLYQLYRWAETLRMYYYRVLRKRGA
jgi:lipid II:glycine glycyltransferase (peptidoglycan interpeptide bridge formation enzyme)